MKRVRRKRGKQGQLQISFGMIFSIILIVAFIAVAIYTIGIFLNWWKCGNTGMFKQDLQNDVTDAWNEDEVLRSFSGSLPAGLDFVCFIDLSSQIKGSYKDFYTIFKKYGFVDVNVFFYPVKKACEGQRAFKLEHINIKNITQEDNPYCVKVINGKVELKIEKGFYDSLVKVS